MLPPDATERGFKDTVKANPGVPHDRTREVRPTRGRDDAADLRLPLPHSRARRQRHGYSLTTTNRAAKGRQPSERLYRSPLPDKRYPARIEEHTAEPHNPVERWGSGWEEIDRLV